MPHQLGPMFAHLVGDQRSTLFEGERGQQTRLATRAGAQVEPALRAGALDRDRRQRERDQLGAFILHCGSPVTHHRESPRVTTGKGRRRARPAPRGRSGALELLDRAQTRPGDEGHGCRLVVGRQQTAQVCVDGLPCRTAMAEQRLAQRLDDPRRVRLGDRETRHRVRTLGRDGVQPLLRGPLAHPAQHRVDETGRAGAVDLPGQRHRLGDGGVGRDSHPQHLMTAQSQGVQDVGVNRRECPPGRDRDDRVVAALQPQGPVGELRGERGVAPRHPLGAQHRGEFEVGIGTVSDGSQDGVCRAPRRIADPSSFSRPLPGLLRRAAPSTSLVRHPSPAAPPTRSAHRAPNRPPASPSCRARGPGRGGPGRWRYRHTPLPW
ncbi:MAG: hypothetical protein BWY91_02909 [bacterium ADurb.BinA028]|nr:MAG: hypothetical protein BWY91_02909 [bacterium ADurb.BinA028]